MPTLLIALSLSFALQGCFALPARTKSLPVTPEDNTSRLIQHPQFKAAAQAAPDFVKETLATITRLEAQAAR